MFTLKERRVLVTGAATGIGQAIAHRFSEAGCTVVITDKEGVSLDETKEMCSRYANKVLTETLDVRELSHIEKGVKRVADKIGGIDILINNAGINRPMKALEVTSDNWNDHFNTNVKGGFFLAQAVAPFMMEQHFGRVIFISSQSGLIGIPGQAVYCSTKGALVNMARSLGVEWAKSGITVNTIAPTFIETNLTRQRLQNPEFLSFVLGKIPKGELSVPDDIAYAALYLASDEAHMVNCFTLSVDGGWTAW